jgi:carbon storage regulator CsrA
LLVLTRGKNQDVVITTPEGREIVVILIEINKGHVRLGFKADRGVVVDRREVLEAKRAAGAA